MAQRIDGLPYCHRFTDTCHVSFHNARSVIILAMYKLEPLHLWYTLVTPKV